MEAPLILPDTERDEHGGEAIMEMCQHERGKRGGLDASEQCSQKPAIMRRAEKAPPNERDEYRRFHGA